MLAPLRHASIWFAFATGLALAACNGGDGGHDSGVDSGPDVHDATVTDTNHDTMGSDTNLPDSPSSMCGTAMLGACNPITNAGCPTGQACYFANDGSGNITGMCSTPGTVGADQPCSNADSCLQGFACLGDPGRCVKLCCAAGDNDTCRSEPNMIRGATCSIGIQNLPVFGCQAATICDWFAQDCANGNNCEPTDATGTTTCTTPAGAGMDGDPCGNSTGAVDCALGYLCVQLANDAGTGSTCRKVCDPSAADADAAHGCPADRHCGGVTNRPDNYGVCVP